MSSNLAILALLARLGVSLYGAVDKGCAVISSILASNSTDCISSLLVIDFFAAFALDRLVYSQFFGEISVDLVSSVDTSIDCNILLNIEVFFLMGTKSNSRDSAKESSDKENS